MVDVFDRLYAWLIPAGTGYLGSRIDMSKGGSCAVVGVGGSRTTRAGRSVLDQYGAPRRIMADNVPLSKDYTPLAHMRAELSPDGEWSRPSWCRREPHAEREGQLAVDVLSPVRVPWPVGGDAPWHMKAWHASRVSTPEQVYDTFGVEVDPKKAGKGEKGLRAVTSTFRDSAVWDGLVWRGVW